MILSDDPIENKENDQLKREPLAIKVADLICKFEGKESFVIGIEGVWGSGKTSFVNLVLQEILQKKDIIIVNFNPWNFTGQNELIVDFFSSIFAAIKKESNDKNLLKVFRSYSSKLKISFSPSITLPFGTINLGGGSNNEQPTLQEERMNINEQLLKLNKKIVVIIDDIDRLDKDETRLIMKLVKMTANFPNTIFLLSYDRARVTQRLSEDGWPGEEYLKKIIQVAFTLPEPDTQSLRRILFNDLDETIKSIYGEVGFEGNDEKHWNEIVYAGFGNLFKTIRDIKRYISSLRLNWSIVSKEDINMVDFIAIEAIRVFSPSFYSAISSNKTLFTGLFGLYIGFNTKNDETAKENLYKELLQKIPNEIEQPISKICKVLFPQLEFRTHYASDWEVIWRGDRRICADERFEFYFQLGIPDGSVSESEISNLIETLKTEEDFSENILRFNKEGRLRAVLLKVIDRINSLTEEQAKIMVLSLWNLEKKIDDENTVMFDSDEVSIQTDRIMYQILQKIIIKEKRVDFIKGIIKNTKNIYYPTRFIAILEERNKKKSEPIEGLIMTNEEIDEIKPLLVDRINNLASNNLLSKEDKFIFLLFRWKNWEGEEKIKDYIKNLIQKRNGLLDFVRGFVGRVLSTAGDYNRIDKKSIVQLYPIEKVEELVAAITSDDLEKMKKENKEAVNLFRNYKEYGL